MQPGDVLLATLIMDSEDHARRVAEVMVEERLAATAHVPEPHDAYRLEPGGGLAVYREWAVRLVTLAPLFDALAERASHMPGIVMPGITAAPLTLRHPRFEHWLAEVTRACRGQG